jgi:YD repeat-containing protein
VGRKCRLTNQKITFNNATGASAYSYDAIDQLTAADHNYQADEKYQYDPNGNRADGDHIVSASNRLTQGAKYLYTYDLEGNRTSRTRRNKKSYTEDYCTVYSWDYRNRLVNVAPVVEDE